MNTHKKKEAMVRTLRLEVKKQLSRCVPSRTPKICKRISSLEGYRQMEDMIIHLALKERISIGSAILNIETDVL